MKSGRITTTLKIFLIIFMITFTFNVYSQRHGGHHHHHQGNTQGAPLDGGLLLLLIGAGAAYFGVRKKNKS